MTAKDRDQPAGEGFADVLRGLESLAQTLDDQEYPGQAWVAAKPRPARRWIWRVAASLAAAAAVLVAVVYHGAISPPDIAPAKPDQNALALAAATSDDDGADPEELAFSEILLVEDPESYSIIDLTGDVPLVSFATKDSYTAVCAEPLLPEPSS